MSLFDEILMEMKTGQEPLASLLLLENKPVKGGLKPSHSTTSLVEITELEKELFALLPSDLSDKVNFSVDPKGQVVGHAYFADYNLSETSSMEDLPKQSKIPTSVSDVIANLAVAGSELAKYRKSMRKTMILGDFSVMKKVTEQMQDLTSARSSFLIQQAPTMRSSAESSITPKKPAAQLKGVRLDVTGQKTEPLSVQKDGAATEFTATNLFDPEKGKASQDTFKKLDLFPTTLVPVKNQHQIMLVPLNGMFDLCVYTLNAPLRMGRNNTDGIPVFKTFPSLVVSRNHLEISIEDKQVVVQDIGSNSGTFRNNARLSAPGQPSEKIIVYTGDYIQLGKDLNETEVDSQDSNSDSCSS